MLPIGATWMPGWVSSAQVVWESLPFPGFSDVYRGRAEAREWYEQLLEVFEEAHLEIEEITALSDDRVLSDIPRSGAVGAVACPGATVCSWSIHWLAKGLIARRQVFWTRDEALEAAGLSE